MKERWDLNRRAVRLLCHLDRKYFLCTLFSSLTTAIAPYIPIYFSAKIIDALTAGAGGKTLALYAALTVGLTALVGLAGALLKMHADVGEAELDRLVDWKHAEKAMDLPYALIEDRKTALLRERIEMETQTGYNVYYYAVTAGGLVRYAVQIAAAVLLTFSLFRPGLLSAGAKLALLAGIVLTAVVSVLTGRRYGRLRSEFFAGCVDDNIRGEKLYDYTSNDSSGKDIRLYGMRAALLQKERDFNENFCRRERTMNFGVAWMGLLSNFVTYALQFGVYLLLIAAALRGGLSVGSIARYVSSIMLLLAGVSGLARTIRISVTNEEYMKRYLDYFDIPNPMYQGSLSVEKRDDDRYEVEFRDVSFRYPNTEAYALRHVSMKFRIGEKLAVVGRNGSGKTTFIKLLCRLYDPTEGEILLNGVDIRKYDYAEYHALFSVVFQDFRLFAFSLGQNVTAGADVDRARAEVCLREAGLGERLLCMPDGLDTMLYRDFDPHGVVISGGEAQKIAIARALYKNAPFLVLDEPTAALDPVSEYEVYRKFNAISGGKTALYISHRLAAAVFTELTGVTVIPGTAPLADGVQTVAGIGFVLAGAFPLVFLLTKLLRRPLAALGRLLGMNGTAAAGLVASLANSIPMFGMVKDMDERGKIVNIAFAVPAAFVFGDHLGFTAGYDAAMLGPVIAAKLTGGVLAVLAALLFTRKKPAQNM